MPDEPFRNEAFIHAPNTQAGRLTQAFESGRQEMGGSGVPDTTICGPI